MRAYRIFLDWGMPLLGVYLLGDHPYVLFYLSIVSHNLVERRLSALEGKQ